jgi:hypothetical protein
MILSEDFPKRSETHAAGQVALKCWRLIGHQSDNFAQAQFTQLLCSLNPNNRQ